jgi:PAS domain S-box-containing protein
MLGYTAEELLGRRIWELEWAHGESSEETRRKFLEKIATGDRWTQVERVRVRKDGSLLPVWVDDRFVHDAAGRVVGLRSAQVDISARKAAEAERDRLLADERAARVEAEAAVRARDEFVATVSHDLGNPLAAIKGHVQLMRRRARRGEALDASQLDDRLATVEGAAADMDRLIGDLLDAARLQAGRPLHLRLGPVDLVALARDCMATYAQSSDVHRFRFGASVPSAVGEWDAARVQRVVANLLSNAVKYSPDGGDVDVAVGIDGARALLTVRDQGLGIPAADLPHVFERFRRGSNVAERVPGTGIGLAGAKEIVELHGGTITVESAEGHGTTVTLRLPLAATDHCRSD